MKVVAVIVTYNRKKLLGECVEAILSQTREVDDIVLIDNNSTDNTYEYLIERNLLPDKIHYIKLEKNIGGAGGFYEGMRVAQRYFPDWIWIMDDDTIPTKTCLEELIKSINIIKDEKIGMLASSIYGENGEFMNVPSINNNPSDNGYPDWYKFLEFGIIKIKQATFVSLLINNETIKNIGYPVKNYFIWGDDIEYTLRINKFYGNSYMVGKSVAIHKRKLSKKLTIYEEENLTRVKFYYYMIRNNLINKKEYYGLFNMLNFMMRSQIQSIRLFLKPKCKYKIKKFIIIHKAIWSYIFGNYDKNAFKNRLSINVEYKDF